MQEHLAETRILLEDYHRWLSSQGTDRFNELAGEATKRIKQVERLLTKIVELLETASIHPTNPIILSVESSAEDIQAWSDWFQRPDYRPVMVEQFEIGEDIELLTESSYWFAGRARSLLRKLPGLQQLEAKGIRNVRNHLLEHAEHRDSGVMMQSFAWGSEIGPVVKGLRFDHQKHVWPDAGLFVNLEEFSTDLADSLRKLPPRGPVSPVSRAI